jgi:hypothetical protein
MISSKSAAEAGSSIATLTPDSLTEMKKEDMKQAIVERFSYRAQPAAQPQVAPGAKVRSPYWQPLDEEC